MGELIPKNELIATAMVEYKGNLALVSRLPEIPMNAMALRSYVAKEPLIRERYQELLAMELQEHGLHIAERILNMAKLQQDAFGNIEENIPPDPKTAIELSKEISRLIAEGKGTNISGKSAIILASKEDAVDILKEFLNS